MLLYLLISKCWMVSRLYQGVIPDLNLATYLTHWRPYYELIMSTVPGIYTAGSNFLKNKLGTMWISLSFSFLPHKTKRIGPEDSWGLFRL